MSDSLKRDACKKIDGVFRLYIYCVVDFTFAYYSQNADGFYGYSYRRKKIFIDEDIRQHVKICVRVD